jgi:hypothetical protein
LAALAAAALLGAGVSAHGEPLQPEACETLKAEQARLEGLGVGQDLLRGPEQAKKGGLTPTRLKEIERLVTVIEQIAFRCPRPPPAPLAEAGTSGTKSAGSAGEDEPARNKLKAKPKGAQPAATATAATGQTDKAGAKRPPKKKPADAYVPPEDDTPERKAAPAPAQAKPPTAAAAPVSKPGLEQ